MVKEYLLQLGYSKEEIKTILNSYPLCNLKKRYFTFKNKRGLLFVNFFRI